MYTEDYYLKFLVKYIKKFKVNVKSILELNSWDASILKLFEGKVKLFGVDKNEDALQKAKTLLPGSKFYKQDTRKFRVPWSFDLIFCLRNSINELIKLAEWESIFEKVERQLEPYGLFVFDVASKKTYEQKVLQWTQIQEWPNWITLFQASLSKKNVFTQEGKLFEHVKDDLYKQKTFSKKETTFPSVEVKTLLKKYFETVDMVVEKWNKSWSKPENTFFVCQKSWLF